MDEHGSEGGTPGRDGGSDVDVVDVYVAAVGEKEGAFGYFDAAGELDRDEAPLEEEAGNVYVVREEEGAAKVEFEEEDQHVDAEEGVGDEGDGPSFDAYVANGDQCAAGASLEWYSGGGLGMVRLSRQGSRGLGVEAVQGFQEFGILWHAALKVSDDACGIDDEHGALDAFSIGLDGVVGVGNGAVGVGEEGKGEVELGLVVLMRLYGGGIDREDGGVGCVEFGPVVPQGLELAVSTGGVVAAVEDEEDVLLALVGTEGNFLSVGVCEGEIGGFVACGQGHVGASLGMICASVYHQGGEWG